MTLERRLEQHVPTVIPDKPVGDLLPWLGGWQVWLLWEIRRESDTVLNRVQDAGGVCFTYLELTLNNVCHEGGF